ncbi:MAG: cation:dicarboxylase symporter family transporter [Nitrospirae bacterium]|nr:cation:dicarboxylase symporter family transporter [Nitrospirota bacterium]
MGTNIAIEKIQAKTIYRSILDNLERYLPLLSILSFISGIVSARYFPSVGYKVTSGMSGFIDFYEYIAPFIIYFILAPSIAHIIELGRGYFASYAVLWLIRLRLYACLWSIVFTAIVFKLPFYTNSGGSLGKSIVQTLSSIVTTMTHSTYFYAIYAALITVVLFQRYKIIGGVLGKIYALIEKLGELFLPLVPVFMFAIGAFVYTLPLELNGHLSMKELTGARLGDLNLIWGRLPVNTSVGIILAYVVTSLLVGLACIIWHIGFLVILKNTLKDFSIKHYFSKYWVRIYPLLWSTASESLSTPLNLHLVKKHYPYIATEVRRFIIGAGSYLGINGTTICVFIMAAAVAQLLGIELSVVKLLMSIPLVILIGFGVPGIPGELLLFAGPLAIYLNIPPNMAPAFTALYIGLQFGLPDSFRTGNNTTDICVASLYLNKDFDKKFTRGPRKSD